MGHAPVPATLTELSRASLGLDVALVSDTTGSQDEMSNNTSRGQWGGLVELLPSVSRVGT